MIIIPTKKKKDDQISQTSPKKIIMNAKKSIQTQQTIITPSHVTTTTTTTTPLFSRNNQIENGNKTTNAKENKNEEEQQIEQQQQIESQVKRKPRFDSEQDLLEALQKVDKKKITSIFSSVEVSKHNKPEDLWIIVKGKVYDISPYFYFHPGGQRALLKFAGKDATENVQFHSWRMMWLLDNYFFIGKLEGYSDESCTFM